MKILYLTPRINNEGGVARVLAVKTNLLIQKYGYQVAIATQNQGNTPLFFDFNHQIQLFDFEGKGNVLDRLVSYQRNVQKLLKSYHPDVVIVTDNGLKGYLFKYLVPCKKPVVFEVHGSKFNVQKPVTNIGRKIIFKLHVLLREIGLKKFDRVVFLSSESQQQWHLKHAEVIPNSNWIETHSYSTHENKIALCVARNSYEKGLDRLLLIWHQVHQQQPDWTLHLITEPNGYYPLHDLLRVYGIEDSVLLIPSEKNMLQRYQESSLYLMTSYNEGMPMVIIEAMSLGLPVVAFDCPIGPKSMITDDQNGFLIEDSDTKAFANKTLLLINDQEKRMMMGRKAIQSATKYNPNVILEQWRKLLEVVKS